MSLALMDRIFRREARRTQERAVVPHCVRCGRGFVASGLDVMSRCWWCARVGETVD